MFYSLRLKTLYFNYRKDRVVTHLLLKYLATGIESVIVNGLTITVKFKNNATLCAWNANKYHAWLANGSFSNKYGVVYSWTSGRPSAKAMYLFDRAVEKFLTTQMQGRLL